MSLLSDITGIDINVNEGTIRVQPPRIDKILEYFSDLDTNILLMLVPGAMSLAAEMRRVRASLRPHSHRMPWSVQRELQRFLPADDLTRVQYCMYDPSRIDLATLILSFREESLFGGAIAVTIDDVVVFRDQSSIDNVPLWAHEVFHSIQYSRLGVEEFALLYLTAWRDLEQQASEVGDRVDAFLRQEAAQRAACLAYDAAVKAGTPPPVTGDRDPCGRCVRPPTAMQVLEGRNGCGEWLDGSVFQSVSIESHQLRVQSLSNPGSPEFRSLPHLLALVDQRRAQQSTDLHEIERLGVLRGHLEAYQNLSAAGVGLQQLKTSLASLHGGKLKSSGLGGSAG